MRYSRRRYLELAALGTAGVAGCTGGDDGADDASGRTPTATTATAAGGATPTDDGTATSTQDTEQSPTAEDTDGETGNDTPTDTESETDTPTDTESETDTPTDTETETDTPTPTPEDRTVLVGPDGGLRFEPSDFTIDAGATVTWTWQSDGHNVRPSSTPSDSDWSGTPGGESTTYDQGYTHEHTFTATGSYEYYCAPHRAAGMTGSFTVE